MWHEDKQVVKKLQNIIHLSVNTSEVDWHELIKFPLDSIEFFLWQQIKIYGLLLSRFIWKIISHSVDRDVL